MSRDTQPTGAGEGVRVDARCKRETAKAILCVIDGADVWIPKSQITDDSEVWREGDNGTLVITEWLANEKGLA